MPRGKPFTKGKSGNPKGRPRGIVKDPQTGQMIDIRAEARRLAPDALQVLYRVAMGEEFDARARVQAANALLDRGYGKPQQDVQFVQPHEEKPVCLVLSAPPPKAPGS